VCDYIFDEALSLKHDPLTYYNTLIGSKIGTDSDTNSSISFPNCAWRSTYEQLRKTSPSSWNLAFPDQNSIYHVSVIYFNPNDELLVKGPSLPYTRYWSLQTYDKEAGSLGSIQDYSARTEYNSGPNAYNNKTAGQEGDAMGSFDVRVTAHGDKYKGNKYINELPALHKHETAGFFFLFLRLYTPEVFPENGTGPKDKLDPVAQHCYGDDISNGSAMVESKKWGWVCPPTLKRTNSEGGLMSTVPYCATERNEDIIQEYDQGAVPNKRCLLRPNSKDNLFLPANNNMKGEFRNKDANYLMGCVEQKRHNGSLRGKEDVQLWARLSAVLPETAAGLYEEPFVGEARDYDVRYVSISSVNRSPPSMVYKTIRDDEIVLAMNKHNHYEYNREFVIWFGDDEESMPAAAKAENAIFLPWPREQFVGDDGEVVLGELVPYPGILYREILSQGQMGLGDDCDYAHGITDVLRDTCGSPPLEGGFVGDMARAVGRGLGAYCYDETCCGDRPPDCCRDRRHLKSVMREHYPSVEYFHVNRLGEAMVVVE